MTIRSDRSIRAVIFDLGGVLVRTSDFKPRQRLAQEFGMTLDKLMDLVFDHEAGRRAQLGEVTYEEHWEYIRQVLKLSPLELAAVQKVFWKKDFVDKELVVTLRGLRKTHRTALLSNAFTDLRQVVTEREKFADAFDEMIISSEVHLMKPDPAIYELAAERLKVAPQQAVFVDDVSRNVVGAESVGMVGIQYINTPQVLADLTRLLNGG
jgi:epoxide hydrolase-like predicted phosphatase